MNNLVVDFLEHAITLSDNNYFNVFVEYAQPKTRILDLINRSGKDVAKPSFISDKLNLSRVAVTVSLNQMEKEGLIERKLSAQDRRSIIVNITKLGLNEVKNIREKAYFFLTDMFNTIGKKRTEDLFEIITILFKEKIK